MWYTLRVPPLNQITTTDIGDYVKAYFPFGKLLPERSSGQFRERKIYLKCDFRHKRFVLRNTQWVPKKKSHHDGIKLKRDFEAEKYRTNFIVILLSKVDKFHECILVELSCFLLEQLECIGSG